MTESVTIQDLTARLAALDARRSFIVQAPAGSGKTELLIQRYLTLLACVEAPEEVVAITFTRKATAEMRERVLSALQLARNHPLPDPAHARLTWRLARAVLIRDEEKQWNIGQNPLRLSIQTIDSLCSGLTRQMPLLSRFGAQPDIIEQPARLYRQAARATLALLKEQGEWALLVARVIKHLDNDLAEAEALLATMLKQRDQWLRHIADRSDQRVQRNTLELALQHAVNDGLANLVSSVPAELAGEICALACYAAHNLRTAASDSIIGACHGLVGLPGANMTDRGVWLGIADLLLTKNATWRKQADKNIGFPAPSPAQDTHERQTYTAMKHRFDALMASLAPHDVFNKELSALRDLPPTRYTDDQWDFIDALVKLLQIAVAQLKLVFSEHGCVDFTEVSQSALRALGEPDNPTDLALSLDYRIRHLLVDEFQDTSLGQYELLERLTAGWGPADGRTLFVVGDPMQSIYRFREAEVGLYLRARRYGIGTVPLEPLTLCVNFRSQQGIVDWVNETFSRVLPVAEDMGRGAVTFSASMAFHPPLVNPAVTVHPLLGKDRVAEAVQVVQLVEQARQANPQGSVAILVRSRNHLLEIVAHLKEAGVLYRAIEIDKLGEVPVIQDLLSLTRALLHPADRIAWLALLRAPWCGLSLADLVCLAGDDHSSALWTLMQDEARNASLSEDGRQRLKRVCDILRISLAQRRRYSLRRWVEGTWLALGGPACVPNETSLEDALVYMNLLDEVGVQGELEDFTLLMDRVAALFALPNVHVDNALQIMTIHRAKGLEFDTVIVPGLGNSPRARKPRLLMWMERPRSHGESDLLLAPIKEAGSERDPIYRYLGILEDEKERYEEGRLLYVAATRAKQQLHLLGHSGIKITDTQHALQEPAAKSLLKSLWPVVEAEFTQALAQTDASMAAQATLAQGVAEPLVTPRSIQRLVAGWVLPAAPSEVTWQADVCTTTADAEHAPVFWWASSTAKHIGTVVHKLLHQIARQGIEHWDSAAVSALHPLITNALRRLGVSQAELRQASTRVSLAILNALEQECGKWVLSGLHTEAHCEYALTGIVDGTIMHRIMDRTFVDDRGIRWIVDYKTSVHEGGNLEGFLDNEQIRYQEQLNLYGTLMARLDHRPIKLGLYFPLLAAWREWSFLR